MCIGAVGLPADDGHMVRSEGVHRVEYNQINEEAHDVEAGKEGSLYVSPPETSPSAPPDPSPFTFSSEPYEQRSSAPPVIHDEQKDGERTGDRERKRLRPARGPDAEGNGGPEHGPDHECGQ